MDKHHSGNRECAQCRPDKPGPVMLHFVAIILLGNTVSEFFNLLDDGVEGNLLFIVFDGSCIGGEADRNGFNTV